MDSLNAALKAAKAGGVTPPPPVLNTWPMS